MARRFFLRSHRPRVFISVMIIAMLISLWWEKVCVHNACICILKSKLVSVCLFPSFTVFSNPFAPFSPAHSTITQTCSHTTHMTIFFHKMFRSSYHISKPTTSLFSCKLQLLWCCLCLPIAGKVTLFFYTQCSVLYLSMCHACKIFTSQST